MQVASTGFIILAYINLTQSKKENNNNDITLMRIKRSSLDPISDFKKRPHGDE